MIPLAAVPVSLIGTFAAMLALGFSINALSLFGLVLAIGIVVDDAIVVVENVERNIHLGLSPRDATNQAMKEVTGPIIATALVLCAVFVPTAFISGLTGQFYRQFALTIAISTVISAFNSLTLSPALCAILLRPALPRRSGYPRTEFCVCCFSGHSIESSAGRQFIFQCRERTAEVGNRCSRRLRRVGGVDVPDVSHHTNRFYPAARQTISRCFRPASRSGLTGSYRHSDTANERDCSPTPGGG